jgi:hypothetical protein
MPEFTPPSGGISSETDPVASGITGILQSDGATLSGISGTSGQFVKGDGTLDSTAYGTGTIDGTLTATRVPFAQDADTLTDDGALTYDSTNELLTATKVKAQNIIEVENATGSAIAAGSAVYVSAIGTGKPQVALADADDAAKMPSVGIVTNQIANGASGYVAINGQLNGLDRTTAAGPVADADITTADIGKTLYVSTTAGKLTVTRPTGTSAQVQNVGRIIDVSGSNFKMQISNIGRANDVPNQFTTTGSQTASAHITTGGASTDFVKGDGSLDSTTYVDAAGAIAAVEGEATLDLTGDVTVAVAKTFLARRLPTISTSTDPLNVDEATHAGKYIIYSGSSGTLNLPPTSTAGEHYTILNVTGGNITIGRNGNNINGAASDFTLATYNGATAIAIGSNNWVVLG